MAIIEYPIYIFFNITVLKNCARLTSYPTETHFPSHWFAGHRSIYLVTVLKFYEWVRTVSCQDGRLPLHCLLKTKGLTTQRSVRKTELMSPEKTTSPSLSLFSDTCIHSKFLFLSYVYFQKRNTGK